ncbi:unnamed protein product [Bacillus phage SPP1]|uniref:Bacteriophage SPP1 complete nucleotide sequence n=2 Tax=Rivavirus TaxID=3424939 RepID=O48482_BPSPP|nr:hypothetical protein SPP1p062 [Bacillus phage SPP1]YP_010644440.1 hypothetical protein PPK16_gp39 [Bacillus phage 049ML001]QFR56342.1 hypothetical protein 049ML001_39 [Bacillus phage 049ML001]QFR56422.1 hypothetical protein 049ML003_39 [Bacillus phage 049ML003]CAA66529.1 unnamed protein product [Bacillus phage SPP1]
MDIKINGQKIGEWFIERGRVDQYNPKASDNPGWFWEWVGGCISDSFSNLGHWFIMNLPDIIGYGAILSGVLIILGSMIGRGGMFKPLAYFAGAFILALCILGGVK